ncbi:nuclear transport factor 2 family protein [Bacillus sp. NP157]|nr:nuclear transport factor 2 family protein [Bacillus sp. NP157]
MCRRLMNVVLLSAILAVPVLHAAPSGQAAPAKAAAEDALRQTVVALDTQFFAAFNTCDKPGQLDKHAAMLDPNLEFYHDNGGVTWTRKDYVERTHDHVCGNFRRKLTPGTLEVYPIKDFGAIEEGEQEFCDFKSGKCFGAAKFMLVWHQTPAGWVVTRAFSYGHHAL